MLSMPPVGGQCPVRRMFFVNAPKQRVPVSRRPSMLVRTNRRNRLAVFLMFEIIMKNLSLQSYVQAIAM
jgi:hypothetical protein